MKGRFQILTWNMFYSDTVLFVFQGCQVDVVYSLYYNIGDSEKVTFNFDGTNVIGTYMADDDVRYVSSPSSYIYIFKESLK